MSNIREMFRSNKIVRRQTFDRQFIGKVLLSIAGAVAYGIVQDQITTRICLEYFTVGHPPVFATDSPTLLGFGWGTIATWWVGLILGLPLAFVARCGGAPTLSVRFLVRPILVLIGCIACAAIIAGIAGYFAASSHAVHLFEPFASRVPPEHHVAFLVDLWAHLASYASGFIGGVALIVWARRQRRTPNKALHATDAVSGN
jgi:hypothetical protein